MGGVETGRMTEEHHRSRVPIAGEQASVSMGVSDTHPDADSVQTELLKKATPAQRIALMCSLSRTVIELSRRALSRANPGMNQPELDLLFVELHYGAGLACRLHRQLQERRR